LTSSKIYEGSYEDAVGSDIVIITSGVGRKPGQSRIDLTQTNVNILKSIAPKIVEYVPDAIYLLVANPVDILTYVFCKITGVPQNRVIGSGTSLDTIRLRTRLSELYAVNQKQVHAYVLGEHGDSSFVAWSAADISGVPLADYAASVTNKDALTLTPYEKEEVEEYVKKSGGKIIAGKGATFYGIAASVCYIVKNIYSGADTVATVSAMMNGEYGVEDVCLSTLALVDNSGVRGKIMNPLTEEEMAKLQLSAEKLKSVINQVEF
jgi:L-lactate dehydrogenase